MSICIVQQESRGAKTVTEKLGRSHPKRKFENFVYPTRPEASISVDAQTLSCPTEAHIPVPGYYSPLCARVLVKNLSHVQCDPLSMLRHSGFLASALVPLASRMIDPYKTFFISNAEHSRWPTSSLRKAHYGITEDDSDEFLASDLPQTDCPRSMPLPAGWFMQCSTQQVDLVS